MNKNDLKMGDIVEVDNLGDWKKGIFVAPGKDNGVIIIDILFEDKYKNGNYFNTCWCRTWRIPQKPEYIPFTFEDAEMLINKVVKYKDDSNPRICKINSVTDISILLGIKVVDFESLLDEYEFFDLNTKKTSPCGKLKQ